MKKKAEYFETLINKLIQKWQNLFPEKEFNHNAKSEQIIHDLTHNNFTSLSMVQTLELKASVDEKLDKIIKEKEQLYIKELNAINDYHRQKITLEKRVKAHIENPVFDLPVKEFAIVDFKKANETM